MIDLIDLTDDIIAYEQGDLGEIQTLRLFCELIKSGQAWRLQGSYGRTAQALIDSGRITEDGHLVMGRYGKKNVDTFEF